MQNPSVKLAQAITTSGLSLTQLQAATGIGTGSLSRVATLQQVPSVDRAAVIAEGLGLRLELLDLEATRGPCGHYIGRPASLVAEDLKVTCRDCGRVYRWVPVEVEG